MLFVLGIDCCFVYLLVFVFCLFYLFSAVVCWCFVRVSYCWVWVLMICGVSVVG